MAEIQEFKCPNCGGSLKFDSALQKMKCPYCDTEFETEAIKGLKEDVVEEEPDVDPEQPKGTEWKENEEMHLFSCRSCGGELVTEATTAATECPWCGNPIVLTGRLEGDLRPDLVVPFQLDKKTAVEKMKAHLKDKLLLPDAFRDEHHVNEIKGLYVPFWLFDADIGTRVHMKGTRIRHWSDARYNYTETSHFSIVRGGNLSFRSLPVDGSSKMDDALMESIEPYDMSAGVDFDTAYLSGYLADRYDVDVDKSIGRAKERIRESAIEEMKNTALTYTSLSVEECSVNTHASSAKYALLPVWILNTTWNGGSYLFAMNGQTGKFVGNLPIDKKKASLLFFGIGIAGSLLSALLWFLFLR